MAGIVEDALTEVILNFCRDKGMIIGGEGEEKAELVTGTFDARELAKIFTRAVAGGSD